MNTRIRAIIESEDSVLMIHRIKGGKEYWVFPGGTFEDTDATEEDALRRECKEELGVDVEVNKLFMEVEPNESQPLHELFFHCSIVGGAVGTGAGPEFSRDPAVFGTYLVEWVKKPDLAQKTVYPEVVKIKLLAA